MHLLTILLVLMMSDFVFCCLNLSYRCFDIVEDLMASTIILLIKTPKTGCLQFLSVNDLCLL